MPGRIAAFSPQAFLSGARVAYDMVVHAFAAGDSDALKSLMAPEAFANFESAIHARADAGHTMSTTVVSIDDATIAGAGLVGQTARHQRAVRRQARLRNPRRARRSRRRVAQHGRRSYRFVDIRARCSLPRSQLAADGDRIGELSRAATLASPVRPRLESLDFESLAGWIDDDHQAAFCAFERSARAIAAGQTSPRPAQSAPPELVANARAALCAGSHGRARRAPIFRDAVSTLPRRSREWRGISDRILRALRSGFEG